MEDFKLVLKYNSYCKSLFELVTLTPRATRWSEHLFTAGVREGGGGVLKAFLTLWRFLLHWEV